jgi:hypothetical protein
LDGRSNLEKEAQKRLKEFEREKDNWNRPNVINTNEDQ